MSAEYSQGLLDTNIVILRKWLNPPSSLPRWQSAPLPWPNSPPGPTKCAGTTSRATTTSTRNGAAASTSCNASRTSSTPIPFDADADAARIYGRVCAAVIGAGRKPRRRVADLMIAAVAIAEELPLFTTDPDGYMGLDSLLSVVPVTRPIVLHDR